MFALDAEMIIALRWINNRIRDTIAVMHFPLTIPSNILSTSTSDNLDLFSTQSFDNVLERFVHTMMQEGQTLEDYVLQVKALAQSLGFPDIPTSSDCLVPKRTRKCVYV